MNKKFIALIGITVLLFGGVAVLRATNFGASAVWNASAGGEWLMPLVGIAALIDSINPCAFSVLLLTIAFLFSMGKMRAGILRIGGIYILGLFFTYIAIGVGLLQALHLFNTPHFMAKVGAGLLIVLGLINLINEFFPRFPIKLKIPNAAHHRMAILMEKGTAPTAFVLGILVGLCEFPCTGGPYLMILGLLHDQATYAKGIGYLLIYNVIFVLPLILILGIASNQALLSRVQAWQKAERKTMRWAGGAIMVLLGFAILFL